MLLFFPRLRNSFEMLPAQRVSLSFCICCCWSQRVGCVDLLCSCVLVLLFPRFSLSLSRSAVGQCAHLYTGERERETPSVVVRTLMADKWIRRTMTKGILMREGDRGKKKEREREGLLFILLFSLQVAAKSVGAGRETPPTEPAYEFKNKNKSRVGRCSLFLSWMSVCVSIAAASIKRECARAP